MKLVLTGGASREIGEVALEPSNVDNVQVIGGFVEEKDVGLEEHGASESELHLPTTRERAVRVGLALIGETDRGKSLNHLSFISEDALVGEDKLEDGGRLLATVNVVLDVESADDVGRRESFHLAVCDGAHEGRLSGTVLAAETVTVATLETEGGSVEKNLGTISERELAIAQIFALLLVLENFTLILALSGRADNPVTGNDDGIRGGGNEDEIRRELFPLGNLEVLRSCHVGSQSRRVHGDKIASRDLSAKLLVDGNETMSELLLVGVVDRRKVRAVAVGRHLADLAEGGDGAANNATGFRVADRLLNLDQARKKLGDEWSDGDMRIDELGHVINNAKVNHQQI